MSRTVIQGTTSSDLLDHSGETAAFEILGDRGNDTLLGGLGDDLLDGGDGHDILDGGAGNDILRGSAGLDRYEGGAGVDTLAGTDGDDAVRLYVLSGIEVIDMGAGDDRVYGGNGSDFWDFSAMTLTGVELIDLGNGWNSFTGSAGDDRITAGKDGDVLDGGGGTDTVVYRGAYADYTLSLAGGTLTVQGLDGKDKLTSIERVEFADGVWQDGTFTADDGSTGGGGGEGGGDGSGGTPGGGTYTLVEGTAAANRLDVSGATAPQELRGYGGNDTLIGGAAGDLLDGGDGHDILDGGAGDDILRASAGLDRYTGGSGTDTILGTAGDDAVRLYAFGGIEVIDMGAGTDVVFGGNGSDYWNFSAMTLVGVELIDLGNGWNSFTGTSGNDRITAGKDGDAIDGGGGTDEVVYAGAYADYSLSVSGGTITVEGPDGRDSLTRIERLAFADGVWQGGSFTPTDGGGSGDTNRAPVAQNDSLSTAAGTAVTFAPLGNDSDPDGDTLSIVGNTLPAHGSLAKAGDQWTYTPASGFTGTDSFQYTISDGALQDTATISVSVTPPPSGGGAVVSAAFWNALTAVPLGGWGKINTNSFRDVWPDMADRATEGTPASILQAWSSMAWDSNRNDLIFWGGGHANYSGNEIYRFDTDTLSWQRASLPTAFETTANQAVFQTVDGPDHSPISAHTYDNNEFLPLTDRFVTFGGAAYGSGSNFVYVDPVTGATTPTGPYFWDPDRADPDKVGGLTGSGIDPSTPGGQMWENRDAIGPVGGTPLGYLLNGTTDTAVIGGKDVVFVGTNNLWKYTVHDPNDAAKDTWEVMGKKWAGFDGQGTGIYDPVNNIYVRSAGSTFTYWDLDTPGTQNHNVNFTPTDLTGGFSMTSGTAMEYDAERGRILLWRGTDDVWELDAPDTIGAAGWTIRRIDGVAGPDGVPDLPGYDQTTTGILGKWKYLPDIDVFLGVYDHTEGGIWAYKPTDWNPDVALA
ncbi:Ig-like domain-containing protein [Caenispirillum bisanense]|uniref:Ca2+-binding protein, RTX toxin-related n=1 Tax=Caenispirillum bisanense TaxID=414052 RepID=A0A286GSP1_9PROT|nr:Ig-like domain-containing protein [Caenispirillum bisanense]SOD98089.1 Ca2+-binding protein, RTX toxin-related [Caenispirillum bisanense]